MKKSLSTLVLLSLSCFAILESTHAWCTSSCNVDRKELDRLLQAGYEKIDKRPPNSDFSFIRSLMERKKFSIEGETSIVISPLGKAICDGDDATVKLLLNAVPKLEDHSVYDMYTDISFRPLPLLSPLELATMAYSYLKDIGYKVETPIARGAMLANKLEIIQLLVKKEQSRVNEAYGRNE